MAIINGDSKSIEYVEHEGLTAIVDFYAEWCGPCKVMLPNLINLSDKYTNLNIIKIDIMQNKELAMKYNIQSIPTILTFKEGKADKTYYGLQSREQLEEIIRGLLP